MQPILTSMATGSLLAALVIAQPLPHYTVSDLGTFPGGNSSAGYGINNPGWVTGCSNLVANGPQRAFLWYGFGPLIDLGTLGGPGSCAGGPNAFGEAAVTSVTSKTDPNGENFCPGIGPGLQCLAAVWKNGRLTALPTLPGGNNAKAFWLNNRGQVAGFSENGASDPTCSPARLLKFSVLKP